MTHNEKRKLIAAANRISEGLFLLHEVHVSNTRLYEDLISKLMGASVPTWREVDQYGEAIRDFVLSKDE